jgi:hypothetical protein
MRVRLEGRFSLFMLAGYLRWVHEQEARGRIKLEPTALHIPKLGGDYPPFRGWRFYADRSNLSERQSLLSSVDGRPAERAANSAIISKE